MSVILNTTKKIAVKCSNNVREIDLSENKFKKLEIKNYKF